MEKLIQSNYSFTHGNLQVTFNFVDPYQNMGINITSVDFYVFDVDDPSGNGVWQPVDPDNYYSTNTITNDSYVVLFPGGENYLVKAEVHTDSSFSPTMCCATLDDEGHIIVTEYFVDLTSLQKQMLDNMRFTCDDNCRVPNETVNNLLRLFSIQMAADVGNKTVERIYAKFVGNLKVSVSKSNSNCGCNG